MKNDINIAIAIPSHTRHLRMIGMIGEKVAEEIDCREDIRTTLPDQLAIVLTEGVVNAIKHATCMDPTKEINIKISVSKGNLLITIQDNGIGFDLDAVPDPCSTSCRMEERGRGIYIIKSLMDSVRYVRSVGGNVLEMRKQLL